MKALIVDVEGAELTKEECAFFKKHNPLGYILFGRSCKTPEQLKALTDSLREISGRADVPILIDQEGGRVARLRPPHWRATVPAHRYAKLVGSGMKAAQNAVYLNNRLIAMELQAHGINVDCTPVLDLFVPGMSDVIGDRAFGQEPEQIIMLAREVCRGMMDSGVMPIIKHIPGHGRTKVDSHLELPVVDASLDILRTTDFVPFKELAHIPWAMTAHVIYTAIDEKLPATHSEKVVELIRGEIGFDGLLITDDLSMKALSGSYAERAQQSIKAGCDVVLHCNGTMAEKTEVAENTPTMSTRATERFTKGFKALPAAKPLGKAETETALAAMLAPVQVA